MKKRRRFLSSLSGIVPDFRRFIAPVLCARLSPTGRDTKCLCRRNRCLRVCGLLRLYPFRGRAMRYPACCRRIRRRKTRLRFYRFRSPRQSRGNMSPPACRITYDFRHGGTISSSPVRLPNCRLPPYSCPREGLRCCLPR